LDDVDFATGVLPDAAFAPALFAGVGFAAADFTGAAFPAPDFAGADLAAEVLAAVGFFSAEAALTFDFFCAMGVGSSRDRGNKTVRRQQEFTSNVDGRSLPEP